MCRIVRRLAEAYIITVAEKEPGRKEFLLASIGHESPSGYYVCCDANGLMKPRKSWTFSIVQKTFAVWDAQKVCLCSSLRFYPPFYEAKYASSIEGNGYDRPTW